MTNQRLLSVGFLALIVVLSPQSAFAQGDGPRTHSKEMLTETNIFSLTFLHASGNVNPVDPAHRIVLNADFDADLFLAGYSRSFSFFGRTAVGSILLPVGELEGEVTGLLAWQDSTRGFGDPVLQLDVNLIGAPAMHNIPDLLKYEPKFILDCVVTLGVPIGEYDDSSTVNIGQNRWYGRVGAPMMLNLGEWVPGRRTTLEFLPAVWFFGDNDDFLGQTVENDPMFQFEGHLTRDFTESFWGSLDAVYYCGAKSTIAGVSGTALGELGVGFTFGYKINDNISLTAGYTATVGEGSKDLDLGVFRINLIFGWHELIEGIKRLEN